MKETKETRMPLKLQFFAEDQAPADPAPADPNPAPADDSTKLEEAIAKMAELEAKVKAAEAEKERFKKSVDSLTKKNAELTKSQRASMTADEQQKAEIEEKIKALEERALAAEAENNHNKAVAAYKELSDEKVVEDLISAVSDADHAGIANIIKNEIAKAVKTAQAEWMKTRPPVSTGSYSSMTEEQIMAIKDPAERQKAIAQNLTLFQN